MGAYPDRLLMADLTQLRNQIRRRAEYAVSDASQRLRQTLQSTAPHVSNRLILNTKVTPSGLVATSEVKVPYASYVREGTRSHPIRPKRERYLAFFWPQAPERMRRLPDGRVLSKGVRHPGTTANPWYDNALMKWSDFLRDALRRAPN